MDELDWAFALLAPPAQPPVLDVCQAENADAVAAAVDALRVTSALLDGADEHPDLEQLRQTRAALAHALARRIAELPSGSDEEPVTAALDSAFRIRALSGAAEQTGGTHSAPAATPSPSSTSRGRCAPPCRRPSG